MIYVAATDEVGRSGAAQVSDLDDESFRWWLCNVLVAGGLIHLAPNKSIDYEYHTKKGVRLK